MIIYKCLRCGFKAIHKNNFRKHINRVKVCKPVESNISIKEVRKKFENDSPDCLNKIDLDTKKIITENDTENICCKYCNKKFSRKDSLKRHLKNRCKKKKVVKNDLEDMMIQMSEVKDLIKNQKIVINNNQQIINKINNVNNNIIVNNFGDENLDYISDKLLTKLLSYPKSSIPKLIKQIHFNPKHPENHNIRIKNKKLKYAEVKENNQWKLKHKKTVLDDLVDFGYITLEEFKDDKDSLDDLLIKGFNKMMEGYNKSKKDIIEKVELEVLNGSNDLNL